MNIWNDKLLPHVELDVVLNPFEITNSKHYFGAELPTDDELLKMSRADLQHRNNHTAFLPFDYGYALNVENMDPKANSERPPRIFGLFWNSTAS